MQSQETRLDKARLSNYLVIRRLSGKSYQATLQLFLLAPKENYLSAALWWLPQSKLGKVFLSALQPCSIFLVKNGHGGEFFTSK